MSRKFIANRRTILKGALAAPFISMPAIISSRALAQDSGPLRYLILAARTGTGTTFGTGLMAGALTGIDAINEKGGVLGRKIEGVVVDTGTDSSKAAVLFQEQVTNSRPHAAFHAGSAAESHAVGPLSTRENIISLVTTDIVDIVDAAKFKPVFSVQSSWSEVSKILARQMAEAGAKTMGLMCAIDGTGEGVAKYMPEAAKEAGIEVLTLERFKPTDLDMTSQIRKMDSLNPDVLYIEASGAPSGHILQGLVKLGVTRPVICGKAMGASNLETLVDATKLPNVYVANHAVSNRGEGGRGDLELVTNALPKFKEHSGGKLTTSLYIYSWGYDAVNAWATAVTEAGSADTDKVIAQFEKWTNGSPSQVAFMSRDNFAYTAESHLPLADPAAYGFAKLGTLNEAGTRETAKLALS
jgi:branched-chain amino acid transport system substrate-binding protein